MATTEAPAAYQPLYEEVYPALRRLIPCEMGRFAAIVREVERETREAPSPAEALAIANRVVDRHLGVGLYWTRATESTSRAETPRIGSGGLWWAYRSRGLSFG